MDADGLRIDRLTLRLPAGMEGRAHVLGRLLASQLAELSLPAGELRLDRLGLDRMRLDPGAGDLMLARSLAKAVEARLASAASRPAAGRTEGSAPPPAAGGPAAAGAPGGAHA